MRRLRRRRPPAAEGSVTSVMFLLGVAEILVCVPQTSAVLCSGGCALLAVSSLLAIVTIFLPSGGCERRICTLAGYMQMAAGEWPRRGRREGTGAETSFQSLLLGKCLAESRCRQKHDF